MQKEDHHGKLSSRTKEGGLHRLISLSKSSFCLNQYVFEWEHCLTRHKKCNVCTCYNHFSESVTCKENYNQRVENKFSGSTTGIETYVGALFLGIADIVLEFEYKSKINLKIEKGEIKLKIDTGTDVSFIGINLLENIVTNKPFSYRKDNQKLKYDEIQKMPIGLTNISLYFP